MKKGMLNKVEYGASDDLIRGCSVFSKGMFLV